MEIKEYNHYGVKVTKQSGWNRRFVDALEIGRASCRERVCLSV